MELTFDDFKKRAQNSELTKWEKMGFPDSYRKDTEKLIFDDIILKLCLRSNSVNRILDIGCGCGNLVNYFIKYSKDFNKSLVLVDSKEMLDNIGHDLFNGYTNISIYAGEFQQIEFSKSDKLKGFDAINLYSVIQYPFLEQSIFKFIHKCIDMLKSKGRLLIGDIPNISSRDRFLKSEDGKIFQGSNIKLSEKILAQHENEERIDDSIVLSILHRYRCFNCETYLMPQAPNLPFANRREDILIIKR